MQVLRHSTVAAAALLALAALGATPAAQQAPAEPAPGEATLLIFVSGREAGREQVSLARTASGWTIASTSRLSVPLNSATNRFEVTYAPDWQPIELKLDARVRDRSLTVSTSFGTTTAINEVTQNGATTAKTDQITVRTVVLPNNFYAAYEALAVRLSTLESGADVPVYVAPQGEIRMRVNNVTPGTYQTPAGSISTRRYAVTFQNPDSVVDADITVDDRRRFAKLETANGALVVVRQDLAGVSTRLHTHRNPTDADVRVPADGFSIAGTLTTPPAQGRLRHPAIVLVGGSGPLDRDSTVAGIPIFAQLAGHLADLGYAVLRYDKRGVGQSGGRTETVTLRDYADDAVAAVKWMEKRREVDDNRVFLLGHGEGAAVALLAAREKRIDALVLMAAMGTTGRELILEQQMTALTAAKVADADIAQKVDLQKKIVEAAATGKGWEAVPQEVRPLVETPYYRSLLLFDPAEALKRVRQPILILQGALDTQVKPHHAERLATLARARKNPPPVEVKVLPGVNHLFVAAKTGEVSEYSSLAANAVGPEVAKTIAEWLAAVPR